MADFDRLYETLERRAGSAYLQALAAARGSDERLAQQGFSTADDILALGRAMGAGSGRAVLDACCGLGGPAALLAAELGGRVVGLDSSPAALRIGAMRHGRAVRYVAGDAVHQPFATGTFHAALVLDSLASFPDKAELLRELARVLGPGGRFGCTVEDAAPLGPAELAALPPGGEPHVMPAAAFLELLRGAGFQPLQVDDHTATQATVARRMADALADKRTELVAELGASAADDLTATVGTWADLLGRGRVRMLAVVAERSS